MKSHLFQTKKDFLHFRNSLSGDIGFVPTMGNLHAGHLSLVEQAFKENDNVIVTIFVNPTQFGAGEDFETYPRTLEADLQKLNALLEKYQDKPLVVLAPQDAREIYGDNFENSFELGPLTRDLCGKSRPHHFAGVAAVVSRLFEIVNPTRAYFGEKDYQQCFLIKKLASMMSPSPQIHSLPIARDPDGLAMSSRNQFIVNREDALILPKTLMSLKKELEDLEPKTFLSSAQNLLEEIKSQLNQDLPRWDYLELRETQTLLSPHSSQGEFVLLGALYVNQARLIDNLTFKRPL